MAFGGRLLNTVKDAEATAAPDLSSCAEEPIHIPGSIQPHGALLVLDDSFHVVQASQNIDSHFGIRCEELLGNGLAAIFGTDDVQSLERILADVETGEEPTYLGTVVAAKNGVRFHAIGHRQPQAAILEFEPAGDDTHVLADVYTFVRTFSNRLRRSKELGSLAQVVVDEIRVITGFDRVLAYRFDRDWNGHVIAEAKASDWNSYLDHWFPESDIPQQARELYRINRLRLIVDASYEPSPILPPLNPVTGAPLDLRFAGLRSVSPIHLEYLRNMEVGSSMSISLLSESGQLWGLIACHHRTARFLPFRTRTACDLLGQTASMQVALRQQREEFEQRIRLKSISTELLQYMVEGDQFLEGLKAHPEQLLSFASASGAALVNGDICATIGACPTEEQIRALVSWLIEHGREDVYSTDALSSEVPDAQAFGEIASGLLAISISQIHSSYLLWFRPEVVKSVSWSGDPRKPVSVVGRSMRIHPRKSFESWKEIVKGRSLPWLHTEREAAVELRNAIIGIVLRKAEELAQLSGDLQRSNRELEAFSYSVSHDLRAPFRHIAGYSELLKQSTTAQFGENDSRYLDVIIQSAQFAGTLVDNLLSFSQVGRAKLKLQPIGSGTLVREVIRDFQPEVENRRIQWRVTELPDITGDLIMLRLVWQNLLQNAIKYTRSRDEAIIEIFAEQREGEVIFTVRDNGVGFEQEYAGKLFGIFQRLHRMEEYEGTGVGLAHVRRIVGRHGGRTWAEGVVDQGATICFSLPIRPAYDA